MPSFSMYSLTRLATCHPDIQRVLNEAINLCNFRVMCGHRTEAEQERAYHDGYSELHWPNSKHNSLPSLAVDVAPYPTLYSDEKEFYYLAGTIMAVADKLGVRLRWGGRWQKLHDTPHFELEV